ncbi:hypothetical protein J2790_003977 [Paenarthrobacter nicotinovorans]|uniref:hypothetical protein n=1 Tax=Micrococcaceae TaxID=1268 RepID=UPI000876E876|nr:MULTISPECIES: hypothetical protein [Micrococcaceae]MDR6438810.1 hypothetical protein [Paenarthrobacter nicotinovorans]SCZ56238.1 hypothetical protein SAMN02799638_01761 [Arthrobacter sp. UNCCL28]
MKPTLKKFGTAAAIGITLSLTMVAPPANAAVAKLSSTIKYCTQFPHNGYGGAVSFSDYRAKCAQVYTNYNLNVRRGPGTGYALTGRMLSSGLVQEFDCWTTGTWVDGDNIWLKLYPGSLGAQYVSDRYVYTGPNVTTILPHC